MRSQKLRLRFRHSVLTRCSQILVVGLKVESGVSRRFCSHNEIEGVTVVTVNHLWPRDRTSTVIGLAEETFKSVEKYFLKHDRIVVTSVGKDGHDDLSASRK